MRFSDKLITRWAHPSGRIASRNVALRDRGSRELYQNSSTTSLRGGAGKCFRTVIEPTERSTICQTLHLSRSDYAVIRVHDAVGKVIETHEHAGEFKPW